MYSSCNVKIFIFYFAREQKSRVRRGNSRNGRGNPQTGQNWNHVNKPDKIETSAPITGTCIEPHCLVVQPVNDVSIRLPRWQASRGEEKIVRDPFTVA